MGFTRICARGFHPGNGARKSGYADFVAALPQVYMKCRYYSPLRKSVKTEIFSLSLDLGVAVV